MLHYQPQLNLHSCQLEGAEALVRWQHPERGLLMPDAFISLAESSGLIAPLTDWVVARGHPPGRALAPQRPRHRRLRQPVGADAARARPARPHRGSHGTRGPDPGRITLEITESKHDRRPRLAARHHHAARLKGFLLAIDDFGTGFSSLTQLRRLPFTELKLDRTFVSGAATDSDARSLLESSVNLAKRLQLKTVAEGIETEDEWNLLVWMGVDLGQGYYMARPMPADKLLPWYAGWQSQVA